MNKKALIAVLIELRDRALECFNSMGWEDEDKQPHLCLVDNVQSVIVLVEEVAHDSMFGESTVNILITNKTQELLQRDNDLLRSEVNRYKLEACEAKIEALQDEYDRYVHTEYEIDEDSEGRGYYEYGVDEPAQHKAARTRKLNKQIANIKKEYNL